MTSLAGSIRARLRGEYDVDPWGADPDLLRLVQPVAGLVLRVHTVGGEHLPDEGPAVVVANRRAGVAEPFVLMRGVREATGRAVRFLGIPNVVPVSTMLRRLGGAATNLHDLASLLRAGHVVAVPLDATWRKPYRAGNLRSECLAPAFEMGVPVVPCAVIGGELTGRWHLRIGPPVAHPAGRTPLALAGLAEAARTGVQELLDEAFPPRWWG